MPKKQKPTPRNTYLPIERSRSMGPYARQSWVTKYRTGRQEQLPVVSTRRWTPRMRYDKPIDKPGWGQGDAIWACGNGFGNCTDFHSLFISAARNLKIPSQFEIGFMIPPRNHASEAKQSGSVGGYHCWAKFLADGKWLPVDISEADKHPGKEGVLFW